MQGEVHSEPDFDGIVGQGPVLKAVLTLARKVAVSDLPRSPSFQQLGDIN